MMNSLTKQQCEWPDPARPGRPLYPDQDGWHWLLQINGQYPEVWEWASGPAEYGAWCESQGDGQPKEIAKWFHYLSPCLTPDEVQNLRDHLASVERERAILGAALERKKDSLTMTEAEIARLRAALATARLEGMKDAADLCNELTDHQGGICAIAIRVMIDEEDKKAAHIRAAAKEGK